MAKKWYPDKRKKNLVRQNRKIAREMKEISGLMKHFQEEIPKKTINERR